MDNKKKIDTEQTDTETLYLKYFTSKTTKMKALLLFNRLPLNG